MPTRKTTKSPTNFTDVQQESIVPVKQSQNHHCGEYSAMRREETFVAPNTDAIMKAKRSGSSKMY